jgi:heme exporter protein A
MPAVEVEDLHFSFGEMRVFRGLRFQAERGSVVSIFGPNGAGKSTFLKILAGLLRPSQGAVRVEGVDTIRTPTSLRRLIGVISHEPYLYPQLTGLENLEFYGRMYGLDDPRAEAGRMSEQMGLTAVMGLEVAAYSRGTRQRLAIARALLHRPRVLLLDEPFTGLDQQARERLAALLGTLRDGERTVVMTTHDVDEGLRLSDRVAVLVRGRLMLETTTHEWERASFLALYRETVAGDRCGSDREVPIP